MMTNTTETTKTTTQAVGTVTIAEWPISKLVRVVTHNGIFHGDDVCCVALLELLAGRELDVLRTSKVDDTTGISILSSNGDQVISITLDIGFGEYDHHQHEGEGKPYYSDGTPMASIGLIARDILINGKTIEETYPGFTEEVLKPIEARDNGYVSEEIKESSISDIIKSFNPQWNSKESSDSCFRKAVDITKIILDNFLSRILAKVEAEEVIKAAPIINNVLILDQFAPWQNYISDDIVAAIFPSNRGGWNLQLAPGMFRFENRGKFEFDEYAKSLTTFIHAAGFLAATETKEAAIKLTEYIVPIDWKTTAAE